MHCQHTLPVRATAATADSAEPATSVAAEPATSVAAEPATSVAAEPATSVAATAITIAVTIFGHIDTATASAFAASDTERARGRCTRSPINSLPWWGTCQHRARHCDGVALPPLQASEGQSEQICVEERAEPARGAGREGPSGRRRCGDVVNHVTLCG